MKIEMMAMVLEVGGYPRATVELLPKTSPGESFTVPVTNEQAEQLAANLYKEVTITIEVNG